MADSKDALEARRWFRQRLAEIGTQYPQTTHHTEVQASILTDERKENWQTENIPESQPETVNVPDYDQALYSLGTLCKRSHAYGNTGQSLRERRQGKLADCAECHRERAKVANARRLVKHGATNEGESHVT